MDLRGNLSRAWNYICVLNKLHWFSSRPSAWWHAHNKVSLWYRVPLGVQQWDASKGRIDPYAMILAVASSLLLWGKEGRGVIVRSFDTIANTALIAPVCCCPITGVPAMLQMTTSCIRRPSPPMHHMLSLDSFATVIPPGTLASSCCVAVTVNMAVTVLLQPSISPLPPFCTTAMALA
jgi:hypothetical protein